MKLRFNTNSENETAALGRKIAAKLGGGETIALFGELGVGKTALTKGIAKGLGCEDVVVSPTFALLNQYRAKLIINHYDMYRVKTIDDLYTVGYFDYLGNSGSVMIIEWSENIENVLPEDAIRISIENTDRDDRDDKRTITIEGFEEI